jgi:serine protease Do
MDLDRSAGALINDLTPDGAAYKAGMQPGDVILEFDGEVIETWSDLPPLVGANPPGTEAEVLVSRNGKNKTFTVTLDALESDEDGNLIASSQGSSQSNTLGIAVESISDDQRQSLGDPEGGVIITGVESDAAYRAGLRRGDVLLMVNSTAIDDLESFDEIVEDLEEGKAVALRVMRQGVTNFIAFTPSGEESE